MKKLSAVALLLLVVSFAFAAQLTRANRSAPDAPALDAKATVALGSVIEDFKLPDADGKKHSLASLKGKSGTVIIFIATQCPVSNAYNARMQKLAEDYRARGVNVIGINSNAKELAPEVKQHAADKGLAFTILKDAGNVVADSFGARVTPEAYLLDASGRLIYRGAIDNSRNGDSVTETHLGNAIEATLAGKPVEKTEVKAFGCSIKRVS